MEPCNQSSNQSFPSNDTCTEEVPLFVTYLNMVFVLMVATVVIAPAVIVINVIWRTSELHMKYYFFVANLLATDIASITFRSISQYLIMILYLFDMNSDSAIAILQLSIIPVYTMIHLMTILLPVTLAIERMIVIGFPYRHRSIMTTTTVISILAAMWAFSLILSVIISIVVPIDIIWPLALIYYHATIAPFFVFPRLTSAVFIMVANIFLYYTVIVSNRKAKENERLGNEEETKKFKKLIQLLRSQVKPTVTLLLVGGIDVIGNVLISSMYTTVKVSTQPNTTFYLERFLMYPINMSLLIFHPLVYGLYMKKIRNRLPKCVFCPRLWYTQRSRVVTLRRQH